MKTKRVNTLSEHSSVKSDRDSEETNVDQLGDIWHHMERHRTLSKKIFIDYFQNQLKVTIKYLTRSNSVHKNTGWLSKRLQLPLPIEEKVEAIGYKSHHICCEIGENANYCND